MSYVLIPVKEGADIGGSSGFVPVPVPPKVGVTLGLGVNTGPESSKGSGAEGLDLALDTSGS